jgi:hypothetical protein
MNVLAGLTRYEIEHNLSMPFEMIAHLSEEPWTNEDIIEHLEKSSEMQATGLYPLTLENIRVGEKGMWELEVIEGDLLITYQGIPVFPNLWTQEQKEKARMTSLWVFIPLEADWENPYLGVWKLLEEAPQQELLWDVPVGRYGHAKLLEMLEESPKELIRLWRKGELYNFLKTYQDQIVSRKNQMIESLCQQRGINEEMKRLTPEKHEQELRWVKEQVGELAIYGQL